MAWMVSTMAFAQGEVTKYVRYSHQGNVSYGILDGETIRELEGDLFASPKPTGKTVNLSDVRLMVPCEPTKVIAVGFNYRSHIGDREPDPYPGLFAKYPTTLIAQGENIVKPPDSETIVSYVSKYVTLFPGDMIYTGTPGSTKAMKPGDVVEIEVQGVGVLRNTVVAAPTSN
jgi:2-keto-4-pentenoate hydratase/2-oxohepta-3-ene-1,7-dioic acid hydratase in catechol pathway